MAGPYFAVYFDVTRYGREIDPTADPNNWRTRWQYVMCPPLDRGTPIWTLFSRQQETTTSRPKWRGFRYDDPLQCLEDYNRACNLSNTVAHLPIVVELTETELLSYVGNPAKTPWKVLNQATKRAPYHGFYI